jgi:hypothetical protein
VAEDVCRQVLGLQLLVRAGCDPLPDRSQLGRADIGGEDGEQCRRVDEQEALAAVDPEQVQVPVVVTASDIRRRSLPEELEHLRCATNDHDGRA